MRAPARLGLYGLFLVAVFAGAGFAANAVVPEETVRNWTAEAATNDHAGDHDTGAQEGNDSARVRYSLGLGFEQDGYQLTSVSAPAEAGLDGELSLMVAAPDGTSLTRFERDHGRELHLIVVRSDGQHFRHVHAEMRADGSWSMPWEWDAAGTYKVFTDFTPAKTGERITLSTSVQVGGDYAPAPSTGAVTSTTVDGFGVSVAGDLVAGQSSELTMTITRAGHPVTHLEPYLGAFGHLVALRDGDLAYLHVHPQGQEPETGETSGPQIAFEATAPTPGRYLLFLDFQVGGRVQTAPLVLETSGAPSPSDDGGQHSERQRDEEDGDGHG